jgi:hypothetical protein
LSGLATIYIFPAGFRTLLGSGPLISAAAFKIYYNAI